MWLESVVRFVVVCSVLWECLARLPRSVVVCKGVGLWSVEFGMWLSRCVVVKEPENEWIMWLGRCD